MAKKPIVEIDEELLRQTMMGDVPAMRNKSGGDAEPQGETMQDESAVPDNNPVKRGPYRKKRKEDGQPYREQFFVNDGARARVSTYINRDTHERIKRLLSITAPDISIVSYINNILNHHLEVYQDEIGELYNREIDKHKY